jgi:hypothetical protein
MVSLLSIAACKTTPPQQSPDPVAEPAAADSPPAAESPPSSNRAYVERLVRGRVPSPTACTSDADCVVSNVNDAQCGCCTCVPLYAIAQRAAEDWVMAAVQVGACAEEPSDPVLGVDGQWTTVGCDAARCEPVVEGGGCGGTAALPASRDAVCRAGHCELP